MSLFFFPLPPEGRARVKRLQPHRPLQRPLVALIYIDTSSWVPWTGRYIKRWQSLDCQGAAFTDIWMTGGQLCVQTNPGAHLLGAVFRLSLAACPAAPVAGKVFFIKIGWKASSLLNVWAERKVACLSFSSLFFFSSFFKRTAQDKRGSRGSASARGPGNQVCIVKGLVLLTVRRGRFLLSFSHFHIRCCFSLLSSPPPPPPPFHPPVAWFDWTAALAPPTATWPTKWSVWFDWNFRWNVRFHWRTWMFSLWRMKE